MRENAFSVGGLQMALRFQLMVSHATTCAQLEQIEQENVESRKAVEKKVEKLRRKKWIVPII